MTSSTAPATTSSTSTSSSAASVTAGSPVRIVIAEDEAIIRLDLRESLEEEGYVVVGEAGRGDEALDLVREVSPDVVILDIKMPGLDGIEVARIVNDERLAAVLLLTAFSQRELIQQASEAGAMAYLVKPFQRSELVPAIEVALGSFNRLKAMEREAADLQERLETRKIVDRAKGKLMDSRGMSEGDSYRFIQQAAMGQRSSMREVAQSVLDGVAAPLAAGPASKAATAETDTPS